ncbi:GNAT family N-acetyltransferase [Longimonas halophila]|uniref:GNAT family N-acetyltransferase n=1 Tax=Longimonas halophila TaxID=1469170 RepID=A0A2H3NW59_9BACT|nr:N-acetyltransferase [Longimonas halophila]PEN09164.1 GNAT family N-acetyltransferase [Longimonas halophila]
MVTIRPETSADHTAVYEINQRAFEQDKEADLVDQLRQSTASYVSLVAETETRIVGHIFFSPVDIVPDEKSVLAMGLAPMAVIPEWQRQGIGSMLVREGLHACQKKGVQAVVVLGHPAYYPRFGFQPAEKLGLQSEYDVPSEVFMALELERGALQEAEGVVRYHDAFHSAK